MNIFVAGLPFDMDDQELKEIFEAYGAVSSARVIMDRETQKSRGFGFVEMGDDTEAKTAIQRLDGGQLEGRSLSVKIAEDRKPNAGGKSGGFGPDKRKGGGFNKGGYNKDRKRY
jgi:RNA recognition motif-containing protein